MRLWLLRVFDCVQHFEGEVVAARSKITDGTANQVVGDDCRDCGHQSGGSGDQRLRNSRRDRAQSRRAGGAQAVKCVDDAPDRAEQADERRDRSGDRQPRHISFEAG